MREGTKRINMKETEWVERQRKKGARSEEGIDGIPIINKTNPCKP